MSRHILNIVLEAVPDNDEETGSDTEVIGL